MSPSRVSRKPTLVLTGALVTLCAIAIFSLLTVRPSGAGATERVSRATPASWTGSNPNLKYYSRAPGYPEFEPHPRYLGELSGSWREIGEQYGQRAGDLVRMVFEGWFNEVVQIQGSTAEVREYVRRQEKYYESLAPEALELMKGIAAGASGELDKSAYASVMSHFEKVLVINSYFGLKGAPPGRGAATASARHDDEDPTLGCSGAVILGRGTADGKAIHVSSEDQHFFPQEYLVTYIARPTDPTAHSYTATASGGEIGSEHALNDKGVVVSGYAGGKQEIGSPTLQDPFGGYRRAGLDWQLGSWYAVAFSDTAKKAVELLTVGRSEYRKKSGNKIVIGKCTLGANWVVSDARDAFVVESIPADLNGVARYGVRRPGDLGESGDYVVSTNNVEAKDSYNEQNVHDPSHPMSRHGSHLREPVRGLGVNGANGTRFMTFTWLIKNNYGRITPEMVKEWRTAHYIYDLAGVRHDQLDIAGYGKVSPHLVEGISTLCAHSKGPTGVDPFTGSNIYVSVSVPQNLTVERTKGRPCEWKGPWDAVTLRTAGSTQTAAESSGTGARK